MTEVTPKNVLWVALAIQTSHHPDEVTDLIDKALHEADMCACGNGSKTDFYSLSCNTREENGRFVPLDEISPPESKATETDEEVLMKMLTRAGVVFDTRKAVPQYEIESSVARVIEVTEGEGPVNFGYSGFVTSFYIRDDGSLEGVGAWE